MGKIELESLHIFELLKNLKTLKEIFRTILEFFETLIFDSF
jgi:hypothetical protein